MHITVDDIKNEVSFYEKIQLKNGEPLKVKKVVTL